MSLNNMIIDEETSSSTSKHFTIKKKLFYISVSLIALIFIGSILITHFTSKSSSNQELDIDDYADDDEKTCQEFFCSNLDKINGKF